MDTQANYHRHIIIDGSNMAMEHGKHKVFSCKGIKLIVDYFLEMGHDHVTAFVPGWRAKPQTPETPITNQHLLDQLQESGHLVYTPARKTRDRNITSYDDRWAIRMAHSCNGVIISNDQYNDLWMEQPQWRKVIERNVLPARFVNDLVMILEDPLGPNGPGIKEFLVQDSNPVVFMKNPVGPRPDRCDLLIDGTSMAYAHGHKEFSVVGIQLVVEFFRDLGHTNMTVMLPEWRCKELMPNPCLEGLLQANQLVWTHSKTSDDWLVRLARDTKAVIVSNNLYGKVFSVQPRWRQFVENSILEGRFIGNHFMVADDPMGRHGPHLHEFLSTRGIETRMYTNPNEQCSPQKHNVSLQNNKESASPSQFQDDSSDEDDDNQVQINPDIPAKYQHVVIEGTSIAQPGEIFLCSLIKSAVQVALNQGYKNITVFVPHWRRKQLNQTRNVKHIKDQNILEKLHQQGYLVFTPHKN